MFEKPIAPILFTNNPSTKSSNNKSINTTKRQTRFDKTYPRKFPVSEEQNKLLRRLYILHRGNLESTSITNFLTMLLRYGIKHREVINHQIEYENTNIYKTVKPNKVEKEIISGPQGLAIDWNVSERKAIHLIIISVAYFLDNGGIINHEEVQRTRPIK